MNSKNKKKYVDVYKVDNTGKREKVGRIKYNNILDHWDGSRWTSGELGGHKGLSKKRNGEFVLIHGSDWVGVDDYAEIISPSEAVRYILYYAENPQRLLKKFRLKKTAEEVKT